MDERLVHMDAAPKQMQNPMHRGQSLRRIADSANGGKNNRLLM
jgi:hypothetical protein